MDFNLFTRLFYYRHQILIKATNIGMKESSTRGTKRRREGADNTSAGQAQGQSPSPATGTVAPASGAQTTSPDRPNSTSLSSQASPIVSHQQPNNNVSVPPPPPPSANSSSTMMWPMPHIAANTPSPVITGPATNQSGRSYYRERTSAGKA